MDSVKRNHQHVKGGLDIVMLTYTVTMFLLKMTGKGKVGGMRVTLDSSMFTNFESH